MVIHQLDPSIGCASDCTRLPCLRQGCLPRKLRFQRSLQSLSQWAPGAQPCLPSSLAFVGCWNRQKAESCAADHVAMAHQMRQPSKTVWGKWEACLLSLSALSHDISACTELAS